jgi:hypothetical protein
MTGDPSVGKCSLKSSCSLIMLKQACVLTSEKKQTYVHTGRNQDSKSK